MTDAGVPASGPVASARGLPLKGPERTDSLIGELRGRLGWDVGSTVAGNVVGAGAAFAGGAILARWLGPTMRGTFELALFVANSALLLLSLGGNLPVSVFASKDPAKGIWAYRFGMVWLSALLLAGVAFLSVAGGLGVSLPPAITPVAWVVVGTFAALSLNQIVNGLLIGLGRIQRLNLAVVTRWCAYCLGVLGLSRIARPDPELGLAWYAAAVLLSTMVGWRGLTDVSRSAELAREARGRRWDAVWFGIRGQLSNVFQFASYRVDVLLVGLWVGSAGLGVYAVGVMFAEALWLLPNAVGTVLLSHVSRSDREASDRRVGVVFPATMVIVVVGALVLGVAAVIVTHAYLGPTYSKVPLVTWLLLPGAVALSGCKVLANELTARGFPGSNTIVAVCGAATTVGCDLWLIPRDGIAGASVASSIGYTLTCILMIVIFRYRTSASLLSWRRL